MPQDPQNPLEDTNNLLEHSLVNNDANHKATHSLLENNLEMAHNHTQQVVPLLENQLEMQDKTVKAINDLSTKLSPQEIGDGMSFNIKGIKGDKGDKGDTPVKGTDYYTPEEIASVIKEITDSIRVPEDGVTPSTEAIRALVDDAIALIPKAINGEDGTDGEDAVIDYEKIISEVLAKLPKSKKITATVQAPITAEEILTKIKGVLSYNDLKDLPTIFKERMAGTGYLREITDVEIISEPTNGQALTWSATKKKWVPGAVTGGTGIALTDLSAGTGMSYNNTTGVFTNTAPDQTVAITAGTNITSVTGTYPNFTINAATQAGGAGDVVGPASATGDNFASFNSTTGKLIKDSGKKATDFDVAGAAAAITPTTLGLVIGTNVQAYNSNLTGINQ